MHRISRTLASVQIHLVAGIIIPKYPTSLLYTRQSNSTKLAISVAGDKKSSR